MPEPVKADRRYMPGLDGLRAIAVLGVFIYHAGFEWLPGGFLGVSVFFTLSGYLITDLILAKVAHRDFGLPAFWLARARRLLPALFLVLIGVTAWVTVLGPHQGSDFRLSAGTAALYVNNWWSIVHQLSYFQQFALPNPLNHLWSLSVEEQFYIVWPLLLLLGVRYIKEADGRLNRPRLALATLGLATASAVLMVTLYRSGSDPSRVYYGTDTRACELLIGAALAAIWPSRLLHARITRNARGVIEALGVIGLAVIVAMYVAVDDAGRFLYRGGFVLLALGVAAVVASFSHPACRLAALVGCRPMRWIGARSYGIYLWHFPIIILMADGEVRPSLGRTTAQIAATFAIAAASWRFVEDPIRRGALGRLWSKWKVLAPRHRQGPIRLAPFPVAAFAVGAALTVAACAGFAGVGMRDDEADASGLDIDEVALDVTGDESDFLDDEAIDTSVPETTMIELVQPSTEDVTTTTEDDHPLVCTTVMHIGDSTSVGLVSKLQIPKKSERLQAQYKRVGIEEQHLSVAGARSIDGNYYNNPSGRKSAQRFRDKGYSGCWVFAMGLTDAATISAGDQVGQKERVALLMKIADGDPVLWINLRTTASTGDYRNENMRRWNKGLRELCGTYPNMRIYDWAADVRDEWFVSDLVHYTSEGWRVRAKNIADALAKAFPAGEPVDMTNTTECMIEL